MPHRGADIPAECVERDFARPYEPHPAVEQAWAGIYREADGELYSLAVALNELDHGSVVWNQS
ncbi:hypothetical protein GCM10010191_46050 [Actinomadura vinacea]|uniref:Uncharacterized protein n=1 Tax=Actinomadura vinacea TaxID=115336 RepID=A0ABN3JFX1_9ACTN